MPLFRTGSYANFLYGKFISKFENLLYASADTANVVSFSAYLLDLCCIYNIAIMHIVYVSYTYDDVHLVA